MSHHASAASFTACATITSVSASASLITIDGAIGGNWRCLQWAWGQSIAVGESGIGTHTRLSLLARMVQEQFEARQMAPELTFKEVRTFGMAK
jgi:hypothetical protein